MKKRIIYLIGTVIFFAVLTFTVQFVGNGSDENNNIGVKNMEALADIKPQICSWTCDEEYDNCCMCCAGCVLLIDWDESSVVADYCTP